jgi:hypothetical protein
MRKGKFLTELIAPCGMNCGTCVAFFGYTMDGKKRKHRCSTCRSRKSQCAFLKKECDKLTSKQIEYCFECTDFPCATLIKLDKGYRKKYGISTIENLSYIKANGIEQFLKNEQEKWKCPNCGGIICLHTKTCYTCRQPEKTNFQSD